MNEAGVLAERYLKSTLFGFEGAGRAARRIRPVGQVVKTAASHAANGSSTLPRVTIFLYGIQMRAFSSVGRATDS